MKNSLEGMVAAIAQHDEAAGMHRARLMAGFDACWLRLRRAPVNKGLAAGSEPPALALNRVMLSHEGPDAMNASRDKGIDTTVFMLRFALKIRASSVIAC